MKTQAVEAAKTARDKGARAVPLAEREEWQELWEVALDLEEQASTLQRLLSEVDDLP